MLIFSKNFLYTITMLSSLLAAQDLAASESESKGIATSATPSLTVTPAYRDEDADKKYITQALKWGKHPDLPKQNIKDIMPIIAELKNIYTHSGNRDIQQQSIFIIAIMLYGRGQHSGLTGDQCIEATGAVPLLVYHGEGEFQLTVDQKCGITRQLICWLYKSTRPIGIQFAIDFLSKIPEMLEEMEKHKDNPCYKHYGAIITNTFHLIKKYNMYLYCDRDKIEKVLEQYNADKIPELVFQHTISDFFVGEPRWITDFYDKFTSPFVLTKAQ